MLARAAQRPDASSRVEVLLQYDYDLYQWVFPAAIGEAGDSERDAGTVPGRSRAVARTPGIHRG